MYNPSDFLIREIPHFNPISQYYDRLSFWKEQKRRCIEGYWSGGYWMPGRLYFYVNFWNIEIKGKKASATLATDKPRLRDIEWEKSFVLEEARGFSGFSNDNRYTCDEKYHPDVRRKNIDRGLIEDNNLIYETPYYYLRKNHGEEKGKPLYNNEAKNIVEIGARGYGKTYFAAGAVIGHNFLFDGATDYDEYLQRLKENRPFSSQTLVGAIHSDYSKNVLNKFQMGYDFLPGGTEYMGEFYPSPLSKHFKGSLEPSKYIIAHRDVKVGTNWVRKGSKSVLHHKTFNDNPFAASGTRPGIIFIDEVGFMDNLTAAMGPLKDCTEVGMEKFGTIYLSGTGGDMDSGATMEVQKVFENPEAYNCIPFEDKWDNGTQIGFFVPVHYTLDNCRDDKGNVDFSLADEMITEEREKVKKSSDPQALSNEMQNRPTKPSEAFLVTEGNQFPVKDARDRLAELENNPKRYRNAHFTGYVTINSEGRAEWKEDRDSHPIREFPVAHNKNKDGAVEIFQKPKTDSQGKIPSNRYIAGTDPYDDDESETTSLGSTFVMDLFTERIVAEYTARPKLAEDYYENVLRLLKYYNAICNYESNLKGMFGYFRNKGALHLLADTPEILKDMDMAQTSTEGNKAKGTRAVEQVNRYARQLYKSWLLSQAEGMSEGVTNLYTLRSEGLLKETIHWNHKGNFDRVSAVGMLMILKEDRATLVPKKEQEKIKTKAHDDFFERNYDRKVRGFELKDSPDNRFL